VKPQNQKKKLTEAVQVSDVSIQDYNGDFDSDGSTITYEGGLNMAGKAMGLSGEVLDVGFDVDITAKIDYEWESDEHPTGWNHGTDSPTYSSSLYASGTDVLVESVAFSTDSMFLIQDEEVPFHSVNKYIHPATLKQLLNPAIYSQGMLGAFQAQLDKLDPPEYDPGDDYEPDYDDRDY
jgi:hypothetical protein